MSFCSVLSFTASKHQENFFTNFFNGIFGQRATHGKFDISSFQISISPSLGLHFESNSHPWGKLVGTHNSLYRITERLQRVIIGDRKIMVPTNFVNFPKCKRRQFQLDIQRCWQFNKCYTPESTFELFQTVFTAMQNVQYQSMICQHQEGLMSKGWCFVPVAQHFI